MKNPLRIRFVEKQVRKVTFLLVQVDLLKSPKDCNLQISSLYFQIYTNIVIFGNETRC